jgi:uncharacterized membrane protein
MEVLSVVAIVVAGLMVGTELAIAVFVHPTLDKLPDDVHQPAASAIARVLGTVMPVWYPLVLVLTLAETILDWRQSGHLPIWLATSAILWILASVYSLTSLVPINTRIASWKKSTPPSAAFGATLYRDLVLFGAARCDVDNEFISFILCSLFSSVQGSARQCFDGQNRT